MGGLLAGVVVWFVANAGHSLAQLAAARALGVVPNRVSLGFGPALASRLP
jgi:membrane-associated protease RseP (regulator of RpoE activity)